MKARVTFSGTYRQCKPIVELLSEHSSCVSEVEHLDGWRYDIFYDDYEVAEQMLMLAGWENGKISDIPVRLEKW